MEQWKPIPGFPAYEISDQGRLRSWLSRHKVGPKLLNTWVTRQGYVRCEVRNGQGRKALYVHRAVLMAFVGPQPEGHVGDHENRATTDNRLVNLRWLTIAENHARRLVGKERAAMLSRDRRVETAAARRLEGEAGTPRRSFCGWTLGQIEGYSEALRGEVPALRRMNLSEFCAGCGWLPPFALDFCSLPDDDQLAECTRVRGSRQGCHWKPRGGGSDD